jgi:hypothetical protein
MYKYIQYLSAKYFSKFANLDKIIPVTQALVIND